VQKVGDYMAAGYDGSIKIDSKIDTKGFNVGLNRMISSLKGLAVAAGIAFGTSAIINFGKTAVKATTELTNAMTGLKSIMDGQGRSFANAKKFINDYVSDGLIPATNAITAYKNLASRGYTDTQIEQVLIALKDSAAFGRQASYSLGDAVTSATEGLKNENSILVDNAGVTKNVAKMWEDYAKGIGTTTNNLTKQQKIQAEVAGILEETKFQTGDAAKVAKGYSGEVLRLGFNFNNLKIAAGNALLPIAWAVLPSINAIIAALTRLANVFAQVTTAIFGKQAEQQDQIAKSGSNAAKAQDSLADATKKAGKEAKTALAGFDELNVLAKDTADSATDAADDLDSDLGLGEITTGGEIGTGVTVSPAVQSAIDMLMKMLEPLKSISFDNLNNAFERLKKAIEPITKAVFAGLEWAYINLFVPLAKWTIEDALPAFLDLLSGGLKVLSSVIEALKPLVAWLWDNFLKPLAEWTGGVIVEILESIAEAFKKIADFIINHGEVIRGLVIGIAAAFGLWKTIEFANYVKYIGALTNTTGFAALFNAVQQLAFVGFAGLKTKIIAISEPMKTFALNLLVAAKNAGILLAELIKQTAALVANAAKWIWSKTVMIASAVAQTAMNVAVGIWNGLAAVATAVTSAFGAAVAFLTSPIGLVIIAVAALVAGVVLLIKHWDEVKEAASKCWDWIKEKWNKAGEWFNKTVVQPVKSFFSELWDNIKLKASEAWESVKATWQIVSTWFNNTVIVPLSGFFSGLKDTIVSLLTSAWTGIQNVWKDASKWFEDKISTPIANVFKGLKDTLKNVWDGILEIFKLPINTIIGWINKLIDGWNSLKFKVPEINIMGVKFGGFEIGPPTIKNIPKLATGAVIPPNSEFLAILGDQKGGKNLEAPEGLIRQIIKEELSGLNTGGQEVTINFGGNMAQLIRVLKPYIDKENSRIGTKLVLGGAQ